MTPVEILPTKRRKKARRIGIEATLLGLKWCRCENGMRAQVIIQQLEKNRNITYKHFWLNYGSYIAFIRYAISSI